MLSVSLNPKSITISDNETDPLENHFNSSGLAMIRKEGMTAHVWTNVRQRCFVDLIVAVSQT